MANRGPEALQSIEGLTQGMLTVVQKHPDVVPEGALVDVRSGVDAPTGVVDRELAPYACEAYDLLFPGQAMYVYDRQPDSSGTDVVDQIIENDFGSAVVHPCSTEAIEDLRRRGIVIKGRLLI